MCRPIHESFRFIAEGHQIFVKFEADESSSKRGFNMTYETVKAGQ